MKSSLPKATASRYGRRFTTVEVGRDPGEPPDRSAAAERLARDLVAAGVRDERVLAAVAEVRRDLFVPHELRHAAWQNAQLPIDEGQTISAPLVVARMCELLKLSGGEHVLDVGTGSGYHAALRAGSPGTSGALRTARSFRVRRTPTSGRRA